MALGQLLKETVAGQDAGGAAAILGSGHRRAGRFRISAELIEDELPLVQRIMGMCVILRAECLWERRAIEYVALSPQFDELAEVTLLPDYEWIVMAGAEPFIEARRVSIGTPDPLETP